MLKKKTSDRWHIFVDGAARNNPGPAGAGIYITHHDEIVCKRGYYLGNKTNNQAEYLALLFALSIIEQEIRKKGAADPHLIITSDSELLVKQMNGLYRVKNNELRKIKASIDAFLENRSYVVTHVRREKNTIADALANKGVDEKIMPPKDLQVFLQK